MASAGETTNVPGDVASNTTQPDATPKESTAPQPAPGVRSPFLGKLVPPTSPTPLTAPEAELSPVHVRPSTMPTTPGVLVTPGASSKTPTLKQSAQDMIHSGSVVSLLEDEAIKMGDLLRDGTAAGSNIETPIQRSIREIGLEPRPESITKRQQEEKKRQHTEAYRGLPRIRTYASDMSEEIKKRGETLATIISAEREKMGRGPVGSETAEKSERPQDASRSTLLMIGAAMLILIGIGALGFVVFITERAATSQNAQYVGLLMANKIEFFKTGNEELKTTLSSIRSETALSLGEVVEIVIMEDNALLSAEEILERLGAPSIVSRNAQALMIGIHSFDKNQPFLLIQVSAYDRAFEGMLAWENSIAFDLGEFYAPSRLEGDERFATPPNIGFTDRVLQNIDVRDSGTDWPIVYTFPRRDLLLITTNESTVREVLARLASP